MGDKRTSVISLFECAMEKIRGRAFPEPNAWERYQLFEALTSIEVDDFEAAEFALLRLGGTPEAIDLAAIWKTPRLTLTEFSVHLQKVQMAWT